LNEKLKSQNEKNKKTHHDPYSYQEKKLCKSTKTCKPSFLKNINNVF